MYPQTVSAWSRSVGNKMVNGNLLYNQNCKDPSQYMTVPCGKCPDCRRKRAMQWSFRLKEEQKVSYTSHFVTLTYDNEHLPDGKVLSKDDQRLFLKNLRRQIDYLYVSSEPDFNKYGSKAPLMEQRYHQMREAHFSKQRRLKYYWIGEYGTEKGRPHYHAIMFNIPRQIVQKLPKIWSKGRVQVGTVTPQSIRYVANYVQSLDYEKEKDIREYATMSKGIGIDHFYNNESHYRKLVDSTVEYNGHKIPMPKYYLDKVFQKSEREVLAEKNLNAYQQRVEQQKQDASKKGLTYEQAKHLENQHKINTFNNHKKRRK